MRHGQARPRRRSTPVIHGISSQLGSPHTAWSHDSPTALTTALSPDVTPRTTPQPGAKLYRTTEAKGSASPAFVSAPGSYTGHQPSLRLVNPGQYRSPLPALHEWRQEGNELFTPIPRSRTFRGSPLRPVSPPIAPDIRRSSSRDLRIVASSTHAARASIATSASAPAPPPRSPMPTSRSDDALTRKVSTLTRTLSLTALKSTIELIGKEKYDRDAITIRQLLTRIGLIGPALEGADEPSDTAVSARRYLTKSKIIFLVSLLALFVSSTIALAYVSVTWLNAWQEAAVVLVTAEELLYCGTVYAVLGICAALLGFAADILPSRSLLLAYNIALWPLLGLLLASAALFLQYSGDGLPAELDFLWLREMSDWNRLRLQNSLDCCGYYNSLHAATFSKRCYPRVQLPGCKGLLLDFEQSFVQSGLRVVFAMLLLLFSVMVVAILAISRAPMQSQDDLLPTQYRLTIADGRERAMQSLCDLSDLQKLEKSRHSPTSPILTFDSMPSEDALSGLGLQIQ